MKVAFLIQAHAQPELTWRFVQRLKGYGDIYLHVDLKSDIKPFQSLIGDAVCYTKRENIYWSSSSQVSVPLHMMEEAASHGQYDYFSTHSGVDYPIRPLDEFLDFLSEHNGQEFLECIPMPENNLDRFEKYNLRRFYKTRHAYTLQDRIVCKLEKFLTGILPKRTCYNSFPHYKGANWFTVTHAFAKSAWTYWNEHASVRRYAFFSVCSDEWYMQTVGNGLGFSDKFSDHGYLRYIDWTSTTEYPKTLRESDFENIVNSKQFFARKMSMDSLKLMDMLDSYAGA